MMVLACQESVAALLHALGGHLRGASPGIARAHTAFEGQHVEEVRNRRDLMRRLRRFALAYNAPPLDAFTGSALGPAPLPRDSGRSRIA